MAETVIMPKLGFDMAEGTLVRWVVNEGQPVRKGAVLAEIETDKATVEVESNFEGIVARHLVNEKDVVPVNTPIAIITAPGESFDTSQLAGMQVPAKQVAGVQVASEQVAGGQVASEQVAGGQVANKPAGGETQPVSGPAPAVKASPIAKRLAREKGIDLLAVAGTGPGGRIVRKDVELATQAPMPIPVAPIEVKAPSPQAATVPLTRLRSAIARRMTEAKQQAPHFYITHNYDMAALMALRKEINELLPEAEKVSVNDMITKAVALTLQRFPNLNASFHGNEVVQHGTIHIGVAVAVEGGLLTIVCRNADQKSVRNIAIEMKSLVSRAREGKVRPDDIEGSTFSISNLGMYDVEVFSAIINPPEAAILAVGTVKDVPVVKDGQLSVGTRMKATISVDHRVSDGVEGAKFMQALAEPLENPLKLLL
jgi:pyruvate dehydrogenase E2 component (dihydrolipoyllysine-residue acetyltransferase)